MLKDNHFVLVTDKHTDFGKLEFKAEEPLHLLYEKNVHGSFMIVLY